MTRRCACAAAAGRHHRQPVAPGEAASRARANQASVPARAHAAAASCADQGRGTCLRGWCRSGRSARRSSSSVPSAISRPPAMTPMRSAMRSATSRMCVVMMTVPPARTRSLQHVLDLARGAGVEAGQRLVEDDQPRIVDQRAGERHLLAHALREALAALVRRGARGRASRCSSRARASAAAASTPHRPATNSRYSSGVSLS